jgi:hypothetical protein
MKKLFDIVQWGRFYCDAVVIACGNHLNVESSSNSLAGSGSRDVWLLEALRALVAFSYSLQWKIAAWATGTEYVKEMFAMCHEMTSSTQCVLSRDVASGLLCPLAVSALLASDVDPISTVSVTTDQQLCCNPNCWNLIVRSIFSRLAEAISGTKIVRSQAAASDLGELEDEYRIHVGKIQTALHRRLHVEWAKCTFEDKVAVVAQNDKAVFDLLIEIVTHFFGQFHKYGFRRETWVDGMCLIQRSLLLSNYSMGKMKGDFEACAGNHVTQVMEALNRSPDNDYHNCLGIIVSNPLTRNMHGANTGRSLEMRPLTQHDHAHIVMFIDAIAATKVSPKIVYQPIVNPAFPEVNCSNNRDINRAIHSENSEWNVQLPVANVTFIGNVNSGKSSLSGRMLTSFGVFSPAVVQLLSKWTVSSCRLQLRIVISLLC